MFRRILKLAALLLLLSQAGAAGAAEPDPNFTDEQLAHWKQLLVVAEVSPGEYYEKRKCPENAFCLYRGFWLSAKVSATLAGPAASSQMRISTYGHDGMIRYENAKSPYLVALLSDGAKYFMPLYASAPLLRNKLGALYLQVIFEGAPRWLPCGVESLREEIFRQDFDNGAVPSRGEHLRYFAANHPDLFKVDAKGVWPRYAIPIDRLRDFLLNARSDERLSCEPEATVDK